MHHILLYRSYKSALPCQTKVMHLAHDRFKCNKCCRLYQQLSFVLQIVMVVSTQSNSIRLTWCELKLYMLASWPSHHVWIGQINECMPGLDHLPRWTCQQAPSRHDAHEIIPLKTTPACRSRWPGPWHLQRKQFAWCHGKKSPNLFKGPPHFVRTSYGNKKKAKLWALRYPLL